MLICSNNTNINKYFQKESVTLLEFYRGPYNIFIKLPAYTQLQIIPDR